MSMTRKVLRMGHLIPNVWKIIQRFISGKKEDFKWLRQFIEICDAIYLCIDHLIYFNKLGVLKWWNEKQIEIADWYADFLWFIGVLCYMFINVVEIMGIKSTL